MRPILLLVSSLLPAGCGDGGDGAVLEQLRDAGADLSKARDVLDSPTLADRRSEFEAALDGVDGVYDGWEAAAEPYSRLPSA